MVDLKRDLYFKSEFVNPTQLFINFLDVARGRVENNILILALNKDINLFNKKLNYPYSRILISKYF